jgi:DNA-binding transcriptional LysR family regulator
VPELRHLRYFVVAAEELNFSRAATRLHMAQPPLSVAIRQLEQELGTDLFVRSSREVRLTDAGRTLLEGARRTLAEADRAFDATRRAGSGQLGRLRVAFSWSERFHTLPVLGRAFRDGHSDVEVLSQEMWNAQMIPALRSGDVDVAVALCPEAAADVGTQLIRTEQAVVILAAAHPLAAERRVGLDAFADDDFVLFPRELAPRLYDAMLATCRQAGFEPRLRSESFHTGWDLAFLGELSAVALAPASVAGGLPSGVATVELTDDAPLETRVLWHDGARSPVVAQFCDVATRAFGVQADPGGA